MKTRIIHTKVWTDSFFLELTFEEKLLFLFYLTNPRVNIIHLYECPPKLIAMETGLSIDNVKKAQAKFEEYRKMFFFQGYVFIKNACKYETYSGWQNEMAKGKLLNELSKEVLDWYKSKSDTPIDTPFMPSITHNLESKTYKQKLNDTAMNEDVNPEDIPF